MRPAACLALVCLTLSAQVAVSSPRGTSAAPEKPPDADAVIPIYPGAAPGSETWTWSEQTSQPQWVGRGGRLVRNVTTPTLIEFKPPNAARTTRTAVIVAPGGGFRWLSIDTEGYDVARALAARGVTAFVLKYRLQHMPEDESRFQSDAHALLNSISSMSKLTPGVAPSIPRASTLAQNRGIADGVAAVRFLRRHAALIGIAADRIGMVGFSAGGFVALGTLLHSDPETRLNFAASIYGALAQKEWPASTPPIFLAVAEDDPVAAGNVLKLFNLLRAQNHSVEIHVFDRGGHGFGMQQRGLTTDAWFEEFCIWLGSHGFLNAEK